MLIPINNNRLNYINLHNVLFKLGTISRYNVYDNELCLEYIFFESKSIHEKKKNFNPYITISRRQVHANNVIR